MGTVVSHLKGCSWTFVSLWKFTRKGKSHPSAEQEKLAVTEEVVHNESILECFVSTKPSSIWAATPRKYEGVNRGRRPFFSTPVLSSAFCNGALPHSRQGQSLNNPDYKQKMNPQRDGNCTNSCRNLMGKLKVSGSHLCDLPIDAVHRPHTEDAHDIKLKKKT